MRGSRYSLKIVESESPKNLFSTLTKSGLILRVADRRPQLSPKDAEFVVKVLLDALIDTLVLGRRVEIRGFGSFEVSVRPARLGRNPKSGEAVHVASKRVMHFKAGKALRERVDVISKVSSKKS